MTVKVAVVGCAHGELDQIYRDITESGKEVDLLLCCGDFQAIRNQSDLHHLHCPVHYRHIRTFYKYYSGERVAPVLTVFIGGNHESSAFSQELPHGGWVAPNIYYLGFASVIRFGGLRICGWSGIYKQNDYGYNHYEAPPFPDGQHVSAYHVRAIEHFRLQLLKSPGGSAVDIFMTHDWPNGITKYGQEEQLLRFKPYFRPDIERNQLGNCHSMDLIRKLKPRYHFSAHLHAFFEATVPHEEGCQTKFTALSKCAHKIKTPNYLSFFHIEPSEDGEKVLSYDADWLVVLRNTKSLECTKKAFSNIPNEIDGFTVNEEQKQSVLHIFNGDLRIPLNFKMTAPPESAVQGNLYGQMALYYRNPQTREFCEKLQIPDWNEMMCKLHEEAVGIPYYAHLNDQSEVSKTDEISLDDDDLFGDDELIEDATPQNRSKREHREEEDDAEEVETKKSKN
ncbi:unnamed protein product [Bursaphelenchus xylophilus]|uniref:(pine wood nematode) hypothetical protein n=1 Tax=Bursaphelenchus xylophilus TaxID=6326 RepID=A0A1I7RYA6_BURXY|nr:unnamed protein product [Bursaphelenchus xylophilus]CAG9085522.1 unnamed protein product [Bursaphelenchus xylophilus]